MATSAQNDNTRKLTTEDRKHVVDALKLAEKTALRAKNSATDDFLKDHHQTKAYRFAALANQFATTPLDLS